MSGNLQPEQVTSEKMELQVFGQPNIKNNTIRNISINNSFDKEQEDNHQAPVKTDGVENHSSMLTLDELKGLIGYIDLEANLEAWVNLKEVLGHFKSEGEKKQYRRKSLRILDELAGQLCAQPAMLLRDHREGIYDLVFSIIESAGVIKSPRRYVEAAIKNFNWGSG